MIKVSFLWQGAMSTLNKKFDKNLVITKKKLEETKELVDKEVAGTLSKTMTFSTSMVYETFLLWVWNYSWEL